MAQPRGQSDIERWPLQPPDVSSSEPADLRAALQRSWFAGPDPQGVKQNDNGGIAIITLIFSKSCGDQIVGPATDAKLFCQFANQRISGPFARFHLSAGKLPQAAMVLVRRAAMHEPTTVGTLQRGGDNQAKRRISCQLTAPSQDILKNW